VATDALKSLSDLEVIHQPQSWRKLFLSRTAARKVLSRDFLDYKKNCNQITMKDILRL